MLIITRRVPYYAMDSSFDALTLPLRRSPQTNKVQSSSSGLSLFLSFDEIIVLGDTHHEINRIGDVEQ